MATEIPSKQPSLEKEIENIKTGLFPSAADGIAYAIKHTKVTKHYRISEIIGSDKDFLKALREAPVKYPVRILDEQGQEKLLDQEGVKKRLLSRRGLPLTRKFFDDKGGWTFSVHHSHERPEVNTPQYKALASCFKPVYDDNKCRLGYSVKDSDKLLSLINALPDVETTSLTSDESFFGNNFGLASWSSIYDLAEKCGIKAEGAVVFTIQRPTKSGEYESRQFRSSHMTVLHFMSIALTTLARQHDEGEIAKQGRSVVNVRDPDNHAVIGRPTVTGITDILRNNAEKDLSTMLKKYRTPEAQEADNGFEVYLESQQTFPELFTVENDPKTLAKVVKNFMAMQYRALVAFDLWKKDHPNETKVNLAELAKYTVWKDEVATRGLTPEHRNQLYNGLRMAGAYAYKYITGKTYKVVNGKREPVFVRDYIYILSRIQSDEVTKNGNVLSVEVDYDPKYLSALSLNLGVVMDNLANVKNESAILLGGYLCERFVAYQNATVIDRKPVRVRADTACEVCGITNGNPTRRYDTLTKALNELVDVGVIGDWSTATGKKLIRSVDKESLKLDIWPKDPTVYITKSQSKALKEARSVQQGSWRKMLKALTNPKKGYTNLDRLAQDLSITRERLDLMLGGEEIDEETAEQITELFEETK